MLNLFRLEIDEIANLPAPPQHTSWFAKWHKYHKKIVAKSVTDNLYRRKFESVYGRRGGEHHRARPKEASESAREDRDIHAGGDGNDRHNYGVGACSPARASPEYQYPSEGLRAVGEAERVADRTSAIRLYRRLCLHHPRPRAPLFPRRSESCRFHLGHHEDIFASALIVAMGAAGFDKLVTDSEAQFVAFFIGFFPRAGFTWLRALLPSQLQAAIPQLESDYPLRNLEGLNIWYKTRLIEEGIESMQNLCTASLVDIMLKTRIPIARVVDWLDQAYLYLHLAKDPNHPELPPPGLAALRQLGVRTATDLERTWANVKEITSDGKVRELLGKALIPEDVDKADAVVSSIMMSLEGEPNLWHVRAFRQLDWLKDESRSPDSTRARTGRYRPAGCHRRGPEWCGRHRTGEPSGRHRTGEPSGRHRTGS